MDVLIKETGEHRSLSMIDWQDRHEYSEHFISQSADKDNFVFDPEQNTYLTDAATFDRWTEFFKSHNIHELSALLGVSVPERFSTASLVHP